MWFTRKFQICYRAPRLWNGLLNTTEKLIELHPVFKTLYLLHFVASWETGGGAEGRCSYSSSYNLILAISRVLIGQLLIFCSPTWSMCCISPRKCTAVKCRPRQKAGVSIVTVGAAESAKYRAHIFVFWAMCIAVYCLAGRAKVPFAYMYNLVAPKLNGLDLAITII